MTKIEKIYVDYSEVTIDAGTFITEITWLEEDDYGYTPHHYFVDYPGIKDLERQVSSVIGGSPLVRYSIPVVLKAFINEVGNKRVLFASLEKASNFIKHLKGIDAEHKLVYSIFLDDEILDNIYAARKKAAGKFGNAL